MSKKQLALSMALKQVEMAYGKGAVMQLGSREVAKVMDSFRTTIAARFFRVLDFRARRCCNVRW